MLLNWLAQILMNVKRSHLTTAIVQEMNIVLTHKVALTVYAMTGLQEMDHVRVSSLLV